MTPPINSVSDERLDYLVTTTKNDRDRFLPDTLNWEWRNEELLALTELAARRAANTPVDGVAWEQAARTFLSGDDFETLQSLAVAFAEDQAAGVDTSLKPASPAMPSQVGVKPLPWKENGASSIWTGELQFGVYYTIYVESAGWRVFRHQFLSETSETEIAFVSSLASAKAAAQANFDQAIQSCLTSPAAEPVGWMVKRPLRAGGDHLYLPFLHTREEMERYAKANPHEVLQPLYTHPAPSASREVTTKRYGRAIADWLASIRGAGTWDVATLDRVQDCIGPILEEMQAGEIALLAALPEREG